MDKVKREHNERKIGGKGAEKTEKLPGRKRGNLTGTKEKHTLDKKGIKQKGGGLLYQQGDGGPLKKEKDILAQSEAGDRAILGNQRRKKGLPLGKRQTDRSNRE